MGTAIGIANDPSVPKRLLSVLENPIGSCFKPIKKIYPKDHHLIFLEVDETVATEVVARATNAGLKTSHRIPYHYPRKAPMLSDYTWNHTTLWALKSDPAWTYIQCGFGANHADKFRKLHERFPGEILFHLEFTRSNPTTVEPATASCCGIPLVHFKSEERLREIIDYCR